MKKEAVAIIAAIVIILQAILGFLNTGVVDGDAAQGAVTALQVIVAAVGALFARSKVYSQETHDSIVTDLGNPAPDEDGQDGLWP